MKIRKKTSSAFSSYDAAHDLFESWSAELGIEHDDDRLQIRCRKTDGKFEVRLYDRKED